MMIYSSLLQCHFLLSVGFTVSYLSRRAEFSAHLDESIKSSGYCLNFLRSVGWNFVYYVDHYVQHLLTKLQQKRMKAFMIL